MRTVIRFPKINIPDVIIIKKKKPKALTLEYDKNPQRDMELNKLVKEIEENLSVPDIEIDLEDLVKPQLRKKNRIQKINKNFQHLKNLKWKTHEIEKEISLLEKKRAVVSQSSRRSA